MFLLHTLKHKTYLQNTDLENVNECQLLVLFLTSSIVKHSEWSEKTWKSGPKKSFGEVERREEKSFIENGGKGKHIIVDVDRENNFRVESSQ